LAAVTAAIAYFLKKKKKYLVIFLIIFTIAVELILFNISLYQKVILPRNNVVFNEKTTSYSLPQHKALSIISNDVFHNFRPALYKKHTAMSSYTISDKYLGSSTIAKVYILMQNFEQKNRIYEALDKYNIRQFINYVFDEFSSFSIEEKLFLNKTLQATIEGFMQEKDFYNKYINIDDVTGALIKNTKDYHLLLADNRNWLQQTSMQEAFNILFSLPFDIPSNYRKNFLILSSKNKKNTKKQDFYNLIYNTISARQYLLFLFEKRISDEHTFVVFRDYYELINSNNKYKKLRGYNTLLSNNLLKTLGVTAPIIRYYPSAEFSTRRDILSNLADVKSKKDVLYIEAVDKKLKVSASLSEEPVFSYTTLNYNPNILEVKYDSANAGYLYFSDCYDTYWKAYIDGKKTTLYKANIAFKAIQIPAGVHKIKFIYDPKFFRISLWFYYITFGICAIYLILGAVKNSMANDKNPA
jgi:hypothetical protein